MATLSKEQQSRSLSKGKKKPYEKVAKITLDYPYSQYWPVLNQDDLKSVSDLLSTIISTERGKVKIPWKKLVRLPKDTRKKKIEEINNLVQSSSELMEQRKNIVLGLNSVTRGIEKTSIVCCLVANNTEPIGIVQHLVNTAAFRDIPVFVFPDLEQFCKEHIGFSSIAMGFSNISSNTSSRFHSLYVLLKNLSTKYPVPHHLNQLPLNTIDNETTSSDKFSKRHSVLKEPEIDLRDVYCYRTSASYRSFIPENYHLLPSKSKNDNEEHLAIFKELNVDEAFDTKDENISLVSIYHPMKVKKLQKNVDRLKRFKRK